MKRFNYLIFVVICLFSQHQYGVQAEDYKLKKVGNGFSIIEFPIKPSKTWKFCYTIKPNQDVQSTVLLLKISNVKETSNYFQRILINSQRSSHQFESTLNIQPYLEIDRIIATRAQLCVDARFSRFTDGLYVSLLEFPFVNIELSKHLANNVAQMKDYSIVRLVKFNSNDSLSYFTEKRKLKLLMEELQLINDKIQGRLILHGVILSSIVAIVCAITLISRKFQIELTENDREVVLHHEKLKLDGFGNGNTIQDPVLDLKLDDETTDEVYEILVDNNRFFYKTRQGQVKELMSDAEGRPFRNNMNGETEYLMQDTSGRLYLQGNNKPPVYPIV